MLEGSRDSFFFSKVKVIRLLLASREAVTTILEGFEQSKYQIDDGSLAGMPFRPCMLAHHIFIVRSVH